MSIRITTECGCRYPAEALEGPDAKTWYECKENERLHGSVNFDYNTCLFAGELLTGDRWTREEAIEILQNLKEMAQRRLVDFGIE